MQRDILALLKLVIQGENDYRCGDFISDEEVDQHFRQKLEALQSSE